jgi:hypothetical protein
MRAITTSIILAALATVSPAVANPAGEKPEAEKQESAQPVVDKKALRALLDMSAYLRKQENFTVQTETEHDYVLDDGQKVTLASSGSLRVQKPTKLLAHTISDRKERTFYYDGKTFTIYSPNLRYYSTVQAPPTVRELVDMVHDKYGVQLPLVDLFRWGSPTGPDLSEITAARFVGTTTIDGVKVDQYAFRQPGLDWQIWIEQGARPLPRKLLLTTTDDPSRPEHTVAMKWQLGTKYDDKIFTFIPPKGATQIAIQELPQPPAATREARREARH